MTKLLQNLVDNQFTCKDSEHLILMDFCLLLYVIIG